MATWQQIESILDQIIDLDKPDRTRYIEEHIDDDKLKAEIRSLLQAELHAPAWIDSGVDRLLGTGGHIHEIADSVKEQHIEIDRYRIVKEIGRGGMSVVYLAERTDGEFDQKVAVKIIQPFGLDREDRFRRLRAERQILASLKHPNIARVFDGGITPEGWPYMVMELVDGMPVTQYCREKNLDLPSRLELFVKICDAVIYAHRNLVVHRDLKPGNILVTESGEVKLLDFGIAKLLEEDKEAAPLTQTGLPLMTPEYAAPEQFRRGSVTTSVDVYSLGVLLYELLAGVRPYDLSDKSIAEMERLICEEEPPKPSEQINRPDRFPSEEAKISDNTQKPVKSKPVRSPSPDQLQGDLDVICLQALRKEPHERYSSVQDLKEDLDRYYYGLPISARPATASYRIRKFVQRHRVGVGVTVIVVLLITGFITALIYQQAITIQERNRAVTEAQKAAQVTDFLSELFEANDPDIARGEMATARDLLDLGAHRIRNTIDENTELRSEMSVLLGDLYRKTGEYETARPLLEEGLALAESGDNWRDHTNALHALGTLEMAEGRHEEALALLEEAERLLESAGRVPGVRHGELMQQLAFTLREMGNVQQAVARTGDALSLARLEPGLSEEGLFYYLQTHSSALISIQDYEQAEALLYEAMAIDAPVAPSARLAVHSDLAAILGNKGNFEEALTYRQEALALANQIYPKNHPVRARLLSNLAIVNIDLGQFDETEANLRESLAIYKVLYPNDAHPRVAAALNNLGQVLIHLERFSEAEPYVVQVRELAADFFGHNDPRYAIATANLGDLLGQVGKYEEAEELLIESLEIRRSVLGPEHQSVGRTQGLLAKLRLAQGRAAEALELTEESLELYRSIGIESANPLLPSLMYRALALAELNPEQAQTAFAEAIDLGEAADTDAGRTWPLLLGHHAEFLVGLNSREAPEAVAMALEAHRSTFGPSHPATIRIESMARSIEKNSNEL